MSLKAPEKTYSNFKPQEALEAGGYPARVSRVIDLGLQPMVDFNTKEPKAPQRKISVTYELVDEFLLDEDGVPNEQKPRWQSEEFPLLPLKSDLATSTKRIKAIDPQNTLDGDWSQTLGMPVMVNLGVYQTKKNPGVDRNKVMSLTAPRARDVANMPALKNEPRFFDLSDPDVEFFLTLPEWQQEVIKSNLEYAGSKLEAALGSKSDSPKKEDTPKPKPVKEEPPESNDGDEDAPW